MRIALLGIVLLLAVPAGGATVPPTGTIAVTVDPRTVFVVALPGGTSQVLRTPEDMVDRAVLSPSGGRIAFPTATGIWIMRRDGSRPTRIKRIRGSQIAWSPAEKYLAFVHDGALVTIRADGRHFHRVVAHAGAPDWWPDGNHLVFVRRPNRVTGNGPVYSVRADGTELRRLQDGPWAVAHVSPAGTRLLVWSGGRQGVFVAPSPGSLPRRVVHDGSHPQWSPDGRYVAFMRKVEGSRARVYVASLDGGAASAYGPVAGLESLSWSR